MGPPHPLMHQTASLDYIVILSGEIYLITDTEETLLQAGDIVIQRGTNHAWSNRSDQMCLQLAILIDAN
ncbi:MAG: cupin domain-containing protein [Sphingobacterium sp.]